MYMIRQQIIPLAAEPLAALSKNYENSLHFFNTFFRC
jgi:hypothetical protein